MKLDSPACIQVLIKLVGIQNLDATTKNFEKEPYERGSHLEIYPGE